MIPRAIRLLSALSAPILAASLPLTAHAAPAEAAPTLTCTTADEWTALFDRAGQTGWLDADGIYTVALDGNDAIGSARGSTQTLFFFSDTTLGTANSRGNITKFDGMPNHTAALLSGDTPDPASIEFIYGYKGDTTNKRTLNLFRENQWLFDCFYLNGSVYVFGFNERDWKPVQIDMIEVPVTDGQPDFGSYKRTKNITQMLKITDELHYDFGMGILNNTAEAGAPDPDGYLYFYGFIDNLKEFSRKDLIVARISAEDFPDFSKLTYFDGEGWGSDPTKSAVIIPDVSCEMSVTPVTGGPYKGKYIAVYTKGVQTAHVMYAIGDSPVGPFSEPVEFYTCPETGAAAKGGNGTLYTYNAKAHPHLSADGKLLVSYNVNDNYGLAGHTYDYHPRFLWLDLQYTDEEIAALKGGQEDENPGAQTTEADDPETENPPVTTAALQTGESAPKDRSTPWGIIGAAVAVAAAVAAGAAVFLVKRKKR